MTYRERREARADRLREWAEKREEKGEARLDKADRIAGMIPFGQPILVGHHSERRHRADAARIDTNMRQGIADTRKAEQMRARADNIDRAADRAIYDDDPDAIERLTAKLADLEAKRQTAKEANAAYRKAHKAELAKMSAYQRGEALPFPSYYGRNLTGTITTTRDRIARLTARMAATGTTAKPPSLLTLRYGGACRDCNTDLPEGTTAYYDRGERSLICRTCQETP